MLPTCLVGSYPQPEWLIDRARLSKQVPRVRARDLWLIAPDKLETAQDDATLLAIRDQERAGIDIVSDGEQRRESYSNHFATALDGVDIDNPGTTMSRMGRPIQVPRITGPIRRRRPESLRPAPGRGSSLSAASRLPNTKRRLVRYTVDPPTPTLTAIASSLTPASAASKICARLSLRAACLPALRSAVSSARSVWLSSTR